MRISRFFLADCAGVGAFFGAGFSPEMTRMIAERYLAKEGLPVLERGFSMEEGLRAQAALECLWRERGGWGANGKR